MRTVAYANRFVHLAIQGIKLLANLCHTDHAAPFLFPAPQCQWACVDDVQTGGLGEDRGRGFMVDTKPGRAYFTAQLDLEESALQFNGRHRCVVRCAVN